jgi:hypothetical protein
MTTYTKRTNAKRAATKAGVAEDQVEITVHKEGGNVRFGWKQRDAEQDDAVVIPELLPKMKPVKRTKAKSAPATTVPATEPRESRNGIKRPSPGGRCAAVWDWMDKNPTATSKDVRAWAESTGQNANNAQIERYQWVKFHASPAKVA